MKRVCATAIALAAAMAPALSTAGPAGADPLSQTGHNQLIERVIQRALSQRGVPFVYGGGNAAGPTDGARAKAATASSGITGRTGLPGTITGSPGPGPGVPVPPTSQTPGAATVGFDASGLIQYAFAGAGIKMPRTSGEQCSVGRKVPPAQARPGALLCYGPAGTPRAALCLVRHPTNA